MGRPPRHSNAVLAAEISSCMGNLAQAARNLGMSDEGVYQRIKKNPELHELLERLRGEAVQEQARLREEKEEEKRRIAARDGNSEEQCYQALVECDGDIIEAAKKLGIWAAALRKRIANSSHLQDAVKEGESYKILEAEKLYKDVALGRVKVDANTRQALSDYLKCKAGWTPKNVVKHEGFVYDVETVPMEDVAPDLPSKH